MPLPTELTTPPVTNMYFGIILYSCNNSGYSPATPWKLTGNPFRI
jgi:hypothetical protein